MDRELGVVEGQCRRVELLHEALALPFGIIPHFYRRSVVMELCHGRTSDFSGVDMADHQQNYSAAARHEVSHGCASD
jgi:hypothetical protein